MRKRVLSLCMALAMCWCSSLLPIPVTALEVADIMSANVSEVVATTEVVGGDADWPIVGEDECVLENSEEALDNDDTEGNAELLAGSVTSYSQLNSRWGSYNYRYSGQGNAGNTIARSGCGLLALTNAVYYLNGKFIEPTYLADFSADNGCHVSGGTVLSLYKTFCEQQGSSYGISYAGTIRGIDNLRTNLQKGYVAICTCSSSAGGHVMAIVDYDASNGKYLLLDSAPSSARGTYSNGYAWKTWSELTNIGVFSEFYVIQPSGTHVHLVVKKGSRNNCVEELQEMLNKLIDAGKLSGSKLGVDGDFGNATDTKLREYQGKAGLTVDGVCGAATWMALERDVRNLDSKSTFDLNWVIDGEENWLSQPYVTVDIYVNDVLVVDDCADYSGEWPVGASYRIEDIKVSPLCKYEGPDLSKGGGITGTIGANTTYVFLKLSMSPYADVGTNFYAYIINTTSWLHLSNDGDNNVTARTGDADNQIWHFERLEGGAYKITSLMNRNQCLDVENFGQSSGTNVGVANDNGGSAQRWFIYGENAAYVFRAECTDCVLDITNSNYVPGVNVQMWESNGTDAQKFQIWKLDASGGYLDINWILDGSQVRETQEYGTVDVYINGVLDADDVSDYCKVWPMGTRYEITDIKATDGHRYVGGDPLSGMIVHDGLEVWLSFATLYSLDLNWLLDGNREWGEQAFATADVYVNGELQADDCADYCVAWPVGTAYRIEDIKPKEDCQYNGVDNGVSPNQLSGTIEAANANEYGRVEVWLSFSTIRYLGVNGWLDGQYTGGLGTDAFDYGTVDVYINGSSVADDVPYYYAGWPVGTTYEIKDIKAKPGYSYVGIHNGTLSGTIGADHANVGLDFASAAPEHYAVTYDANGGLGTMPNGTATEGIAFTLPACGFIAPSNKQFKAWSINGKEYAPGASYTFIDNATVTAVWNDFVNPNEPQIVIENQTASPGSTFTVPILFKNNPGIAGFGLQISYNTQYLELKQSEKGDIAGVQFGNIGSPYAISLGQDENATGEVAAILTFSVKDTAPSNESIPIEVSYKQGGVPYAIVGEEGDTKDVSFSLTAGSVTIEDYIPGDANGDKSVDPKDATRILQYYNGKKVTIDMNAADANGDDNVDPKDATRVLQYYNGKKVTLGKSNKTATLTGILAASEIPAVLLELNEKVVVETNKTTVAPGEEFQAAIKFKNNPGIAGFGLQIEYNTEYLELQSGNKGDMSVAFGDIGSPYAISLGQDENTTAELSATLNFKVKENVSSAEPIPIKVSFKMKPYAVIGEEGDTEDVDFELVSTSIQIKSSEPVTKTLESIAVTTKPTKMTYTEGETFDLTGMVVTATYSDESTATISDYTITPTAALTTANTTVTVSYTEDGVTKTATVDITVTKPEPAAKTLESIAVTTKPSKTAYTAGETFDPTGMVVTATYSDESTATISDYTITPTAALTTANTTVTLSYTEDGVTKTATVDITVTKPEPAAKTLESIAVTTKPSKTAYTAGETFDPTGMVVTATYSDESTATVSDYTTTPTAALTTANTTVMVSYSEDGVTKTATVDITVTEPEPATKTLESIAVTTKPTKTAYTEGETFESAGIAVTATYSDGTTAAVTNYSTSPTTALKVSDTTVTVSYSEDGVTKTATVDITVTESGSNPNPNPDSDTTSKGCYVATSVYGSYDCPEVWTLRRFRDNVLAETWYGRLFIRLYYAVSPTAVKWFGDCEWFQNFFRSMLDPWVADLQSEGFESTPYQDMDW